MINLYDRMIRQHIESFLSINNGKKKIPVIGLQNDDETGDATMSQAGADKDRIEFPVVSVFRMPVMTVSDNSETKRVANYSGYTLLDEEDHRVHLNVMRCTLNYAVDVWAESKKATEDLMMQIYFRLRNNPNVPVKIVLPVKNEDGEIESATCVPEIVMGTDITHLKLQNTESAQVYKLRCQFQLKNVNIYDITDKHMFDIEYIVTARLATN